MSKPNIKSAIKDRSGVQSIEYLQFNVASPVDAPSNAICRALYHRITFTDNLAMNFLVTVGNPQILEGYLSLYPNDSKVAMIFPVSAGRELIRWEEFKICCRKFVGTPIVIVCESSTVLDEFKQQIDPNFYWMKLSLSETKGSA